MTVSIVCVKKARDALFLGQVPLRYLMVSSLAHLSTDSVTRLGEIDASSLFVTMVKNSWFNTLHSSMNWISNFSIRDLSVVKLTTWRCSL